MYLSHIISYLIGYKQRVFHAAMVDKFEDWSTASAWQRVQKKYGIYFVDLSNISGDDGKWDDKYIQALKRLNKNEAEIIGLIRKEVDADRVISMLKEQGIYIDKYVNIESWSSERQYIGTYEKLERSLLEL